MRKLIYWLLLPLAVAVSACGGKKGSSDNTSTLAMIDSVDAHGLQRMQTSKSETDFKFKGKDYHSLVSRTPDENLPHVTNELGDTYVDNKIVLHLTRGNETVLNKTFTKNDFSSVVDANFLSKSILEGIVYDKTTPQGFVVPRSIRLLLYECQYHQKTMDCFMDANTQCKWHRRRYHNGIQT